jgi:hypothetical protein
MPDGLKKGGMVKAGGPKTAVMPLAAALCWWATTCAPHLREHTPLQEVIETKANSSCLRERENMNIMIWLCVCVSLCMLGRDCY